MSESASQEDQNAPLNLSKRLKDTNAFIQDFYFYYRYGGKNGLIARKVAEFIRWFIVLALIACLAHYVNYDVLSRHKQLIANGEIIWLSDVFQMNGYLQIWTIVQITLYPSITFLIIKIIWDCRRVYCSYNKIHGFIKDVLNIDESAFTRMSWPSLLQDLIHELKHQENPASNASIPFSSSFIAKVNELNLCQMILRFENIMIALINKSILPTKFKTRLGSINIPCSKGVVLNLKHFLFLNLGFSTSSKRMPGWRLFSGLQAPFQNCASLRSSYFDIRKREELTAQIRCRIAWFIFANFFICLASFIFRPLYAFFELSEFIKRKSGSLGTRTWTTYSQFYLRAFNELEHEFEDRLARAYYPSKEYLNGFASVSWSIIAQNVVFAVGAVFAAFTFLTIYDEDFMSVAYLPRIVAGCAALAAVFQAYIPEEYVPFRPSESFKNVIGEIHYFPIVWIKKTREQKVANKLAELFVSKVEFWFFEFIVNPLRTFLFMCELYYCAEKIVEFLQENIVRVDGVGDICSFSEMDLSGNGDPTWHFKGHVGNFAGNHQRNQMANDGKIELSLVRFALAYSVRLPLNDETELFFAELQMRMNNERPGLNLSRIRTNDYTALSEAMALSILLLHKEKEKMQVERSDQCNAQRFTLDCQINTHSGAGLLPSEEQINDQLSQMTHLEGDLKTVIHDKMNQVRHGIVDVGKTAAPLDSLGKQDVTIVKDEAGNTIFVREGQVYFPRNFEENSECSSSESSFYDMPIKESSWCYICFLISSPILSILSIALLIYSLFL